MGYKSKGTPSLRNFVNKRLAGMKQELANRIAPKVAQKITERARASFAAGQTVYGDARPAGVQGDKLTLVKTGLAQSTLHFTAVGSVVRAVLSAPYVKYLIGKYKILPIGNAALPFQWLIDIRKIVNDAVAADVRAGAREAA